MNLNPFNAGMLRHSNRWSARGEVPRGEWERKSREFLHDGMKGWRLKSARPDGDIVLLDFVDEKPLLLRPVAFMLPETKRNLVVDVGVHRALDKLFGLNGPPGALITIGVDNGTVNPNANFVSSTNGDTSTGSSTSRRLIAFASNSRTAKVVTNSGAFTNTNANFVHKRLFLSAAAAGTTDANGDLAAMTNVFTLDFTGFASFSQTYSTTYTGAGS